MQIANVIEQPHLLFIGANGKKCFGITVENTDSVEVCHEKGTRKKWCENEYTLLNTPKEKIMEKFGLSENDYNSMMMALKELIANTEK